MAHVLGIDPSLTSTGIAVITADLQVTTRRIESAPPKRAKGDKTPATLLERAVRIRDIIGRALPEDLYKTPADLAVIEGPSYSSAGSGTWDRAGLWWAFVEQLQTLRIPIAVCPPAVRGKWATGSGAAGKGSVSAGLARMWPTVPENISDDQWDALALASIGAQRLGWLPVGRAQHREQLGKVAWPELVGV